MPENIQRKSDRFSTYRAHNQKHRKRYVALFHLG